MKNTRRRGRQVLAGLAVCLLSLAAGADDNTFDFEMILFERPAAPEVSAMPEDTGEPQSAVARDRLDRLTATPRVLDPVSFTLRQRGMKVHEHLAWRMSPSSRSNDTWYWVGNGRLEGLVQISRARFLHLDLDLVLRPADGSGPYRVRLNRRMRSGELHYVDHPRLGVLIQAERYQPPAAEPAPVEEPPTGEPRPAAPVGTPAPVNGNKGAPARAVE